jgi:ankyrin repeat protein
MIKLLAENKADFNVINKENMTALYKYCTGRQNLRSLDEKKDFVRALIDAGAKTDITLKRDLPLLNAVLLKVLASNPDHAEIAEVLIEKGCPVNRACRKEAEAKKSTTFTEGDTPLHIVIKRDGFQTLAKRDMIILLVENGANKYAKNKKKETPKSLLSRKSPYYEKMYYDALMKTRAKRHSKK